ncbi:MAG: serine acetyltransferase [Spirochaetaceae bacterium]|nr:MAG: serine acetyltransferase [Spirochaetaceae bacterium]
MKTKLDRIVEEITASYRKTGGINHLEGPNLPSRRSIGCIVRAFEALIFPGYHDDEVIDELNMGYVVGQRVACITRNLIDEIGKSFSYHQRLLGTEAKSREEISALVMEILSLIPEIRARIKLDVDAAFAGDPAAKSGEEVILAYPCIPAILVHRVAHEFWIRGIPLIPRMMSEYVHSRTGIDIHPGAAIKDHFFIDHGTGVVIGETTEIGKNVKIYQGVTLGALSVRKDLGNKKRHPTIENNVTIYAGATILGGETVVGEGSVIGGNVWVTESVPPGSRVYYQPGKNHVNKGMD